MTIPITIETARDVQKINKAAMEFWCDIYVHSDKVMIDAKSVLGLATLVGQKNLILVFPDDVDQKIIEKAIARA